VCRAGRYTVQALLWIDTAAALRIVLPLPHGAGDSTSWPPDVLAGPPGANEAPPVARLLRSRHAMPDVTGRRHDPRNPMLCVIPHSRAGAIGAILPYALQIAPGTRRPLHTIQTIRGWAISARKSGWKTQMKTQKQ
jgi:hypothetical protein